MSKSDAINTTQLSISHYEKRGTIHRDYIAHCLRWSHAVRMIQRVKDAFVLDVGCADFPLARLLWTNRIKARLYVGVDFRDMSGKVPSMDYFPIEFACGTAVEMLPSIVKRHGIPTVITSFEMIEHIPREDAIETLRTIHSAMDARTLFLLSTPCFNGSKAANHIYEWGYIELREELHALGFLVQACYGTFASQHDLESVLSVDERALFNKLSRYYEPSMLSVMLAPLFPEVSRNAIWELRLAWPDLPERKESLR